MARVYRLPRVAAVLLLACSPAPDPAPAPAPEPAPTQAAPASLAPQPLATPPVFDLVATPEGALLAWVAPGPCDQALRLQPLDDRGAPVGEPKTLAACAAASAPEARVSELALAAAAGKLGITWILEHPSGARLRGTHGDDRADALAPVEDIDPTVPASVASHGRLSMTAASTGQLLIAYRTTPGPCRAHGDGECAHYVARPHPRRTPTRGRGVELREVPDPCDPMLAGLLVRDGTWYDAVCSRHPEPRPTVFVIQPEIYYAEAVEALPGCTPVGVAPAPRGAALLGRCDDGLAAQTLSPDGRGDSVLRGVRRRVACQGGRPLLSLAGEGGAEVELPLGGQLSRLGLLLPPSVAPPGARAAFTGRRLIVATLRSGQLTLERHACGIAQLERQDP